MKAIQEAVAAYLGQRTGVKTVCDRSRCREYPLLAVEVREAGTVLLAGGALAEHSYTVTVTAVSDRERDGTTALLAPVPGLLLRGVPMETEDGGRVLHPLDIRTEGEELTFTVTLCVPVPPLPKPGETPPGVMETLHMAL